MSFLKPSCAVLIAAFACAADAQNSHVAVYGETYPFSLAQAIFLRNNGSDPTTKFGLTAYLSPGFGLGLESGFYWNSGFKGDGTNFSEQPPSSAIYAGLAATIRLLEGEKASLALSGKAGATFMQAAASVFTTTEHYENYSVIVPSFFLGLEPSVYMSPSVSLYTDFGVKLVLTPDGKSIDTKSPAYNPAAGSFPLKSANDANTTIMTDGLAIGIRYHF